MKEPKRLRDARSDRLATVLLEAGHSDGPSKERLARMLGGVAGTGATLAATAAAASAGVAGSVAHSSIPIALVVKWLGLGAFAGVIASMGAPALLPNQPPSSAEEGLVLDDRSQVAAATPRARTADVPGLSSATVPVAASALISVAVPRTSLKRRAKEPASVENGESSSIAAPEARAVGEEVAALGLAKAALNRGTPAEALRSVREYHARFPRGRLAPEARYLEMEAELANGNRDRARALAAELARGSTPNAERARAILKGEEQ